MKYSSTRGSPQNISFEEAVITGLAPDGGLFVPDSVPSVDQSTLERWRELSFVEVATEVMALFVDEAEIPRTDLQRLCEASYGAQSRFRDARVAPVVAVRPAVFVMELFHGPTFAFKDVALQFLGNLFEYFLERKPEAARQSITVLGATSGDTGSAAIHGLKGKRNVEVFILHPLERLSLTQEKQMTTVLDANVHNVALRGTFDDCQNIVKECFGDAAFNRKHRLAAVNSINWARILAQIVYYFTSYFQWCALRAAAGRPVTFGKDTCVFAVPTGNFGDILAGYYAKRMGLPIHRLVVATNRNDILHRFFSAGDYSLAGGVVPTIAPSMDIQISSNFERYLFYLSGSDPVKLKSWMDAFKADGKLPVPAELAKRAQDDFASAAVSEEEILGTIAAAKADHDYLLCPHSATGMKASVDYVAATGGAHDVISLATAHIGKFADAVKEAVPGGITLPTQLAELHKLEARKDVLDATCAAVQQYVDAALPAHVA